MGPFDRRLESAYGDESPEDSYSADEELRPSSHSPSASSSNDAALKSHTFTPSQGQDKRDISGSTKDNALPPRPGRSTCRQVGLADHTALLDSDWENIGEVASPEVRLERLERRLAGVERRLAWLEIKQEKREERSKRGELGERVKGRSG